MNTHVCEVAPHRWEVAEQLAKGLDVPLVVGIVLARRGFESVAEARAFLDIEPQVHDPFLLGGMAEAVDLLEHAVTGGRSIVVHGDYDVDGISATCLLSEGLRALGADVTTYLPNRFEQGYGLSEEAVGEIAEGGGEVLVTVDCGVSYPDEVDLAKSRGLDVVVTDHHRPGDKLPACPVLHPRLGEYLNPHLCGAGVAFKLLHGMNVRMKGGEPTAIPGELFEALDLVALATVADLVPVLGENRYLVSEGLKQIAVGRRPGVRALLEVSRALGSVDTETLAFRLAPRLNAAGRMTDPEDSLRLLQTQSETEAARLAEQLDGLNRRRRDVERGMLEEAVAQAEAEEAVPPVLVLSGEGWHEGVVGIVASRVSERFHRPTVLLAVKDGIAKGSGRSIPGYDLMEGLGACADLLSEWGGHEQAAGLTLPADRVPAFGERLEAHAAAVLEQEDLRPRYVPDAVVRGDELTLETVDGLSRLAPFGMGNPPVRLLAVGARLENLRATRNGDHLQCEIVVDGVRSRAVGFRLADKIEVLDSEPVHVGLELKANEWQGSTRAEAHVHSFYRSPDHGAHALGCSPACLELDPLWLPAREGCCTASERQTADPALLPGRDLRDGGGRLSVLAQILSTGEPAAILSASVSRRMQVLSASLPLAELGIPGVECVSRLCFRTKSEIRDGALLFVDWDAAVARQSLLRSRRHVVVVDPPYEARQRSLLAELDEAGTHVHLCWGREERSFTQNVLKAVLHPRLWVGALLQAESQGLTDAEARQAAAERAWEKHGVLPSVDDLIRAEEIVGELRRLPGAAGEGTMSLEDSSLYLQAKDRYEEASRRCASA